MSFIGSIANSLVEKAKRVAGMVPPYEVVETTAQQFAKFVAIYYWLYSLQMIVLVLSQSHYVQLLNIS